MRGAVRVRAIDLMLLASVLLLSPCVAAAADTGVDVAGVFDRVGKLPPPEQQAWLKRLEQRSARAARLTLEPDEAARRQAETYAKLHQKTISWQTLRGVVVETDAREKAAVERLADRYRRLVFDTFSDEIDEYNQRQQAWRDVRGQWEQSGSRFDEQDRLIDWLEAAIAAATPKKIAPIPKRPEVVASGEETVASGEWLVASEKEPDPKIPKSPNPEIPNNAGPHPSPLPKGEGTDVEKPLPSKGEGAGAGKPSASKAEKAGAEKTLPRKAEESPVEKTPDVGVEIRLDELAARINGCNLAFRAMEMDLDERGPWTAARLTPLVERLDVLALRRHDLELFRQAVPEKERALLAPLPDLKGVISQFAARIVEVRSQVSGSSFKGTDSERQAELRRLDDLSRRLAEAAAK